MTQQTFWTLVSIARKQGSARLAALLKNMGVQLQHAVIIVRAVMNKIAYINAYAIAFA